MEMYYTGDLSIGPGNAAVAIAVVTMLLTLAVFIVCCAAAHRILLRKGYDDSVLWIGYFFGPLLLLYSLFIREKRRILAMRLFKISRLTVMTLIVILLATTSCGVQDTTSAASTNLPSDAEIESIPENLDEKLIKADHSSELTDDNVIFEAEWSKYALTNSLFMGILKNNREKDIGYSHAKLEKLVNGEWYSIPYLPNAVETLELPTVGPGQQSVCGVAMTVYDYTLTKGTYRLVVNYNDLTEYENAHTGEMPYVTFAEFYVVDSEDADEPVFKDINEQALDRETAIQDGCVVLEKNAVYNAPVLDSFLNKSLLGMPCAMRVVYPEDHIVRHITYTGQGFLLIRKDAKNTTRELYSYLSVQGEDFVLSNYAVPDNAARLGFDISGTETILPLPDGSIANLQKDMDKRNSTIMKVYLDDEFLHSVAVLFPFNITDRENVSRFNIGYQNGGTSEILGDIYPDGLRPVSVRRLSDTTAEFSFIDADGNVTAMTLDVTDGRRGLVPSDK